MSKRLVPRFDRDGAEQDVESTYFPYTRALDGSLQAPDTIKQNGVVVLRYVPESRSTDAARTLISVLQFYRILMYGLNRRERLTWLALLIGYSPEHVAKSEGKRRQTVLARIRGNRGRGGMIRKNVFVLAWWLSGKKKINQYK